MLLKALRVKDFRQFKGEQIIEFSTDTNRNVTILMGSNGSGKTTLAQAFTWCLYGNTDFDDKSLLCKAKATEMMPNDEEKVVAEIKLIHNNMDYTMIREQKYSKDKNGILRQPNQTKFNIFYKNADGQREFVDDLHTEMRMKEILPKELSRYFFFDGERIGNMSKEIRKGKSKEFAQAVKSLLGLNAFIAAISHLNASPPKNSVVRNYDKSYDSQSNKKIGDYNKKIEDLEEKNGSIDQRLEELKNESKLAEEMRSKLNEQIQANEESESLAIEKNEVIKRINAFEILKHETITSMLKLFNKYSLEFFSKKMINDSLSFLSEADELNKGVPDIHARTIDYLVKRGVCICGNSIEDGNSAYKKLQELLEYIPPHSIGNSLNQFANECELYTKNADLLYENFISQFKSIREYENESIQLSEKKDRIDEKLNGLKNVGKLQESLMKYEQVLRNNSNERDGNNVKKGELTGELERLKSKRKELTLQDDNNRRIEIYKAYALFMHQTLSERYKHEEQKIRTMLQDVVNSIFKTIYNGGLSLSLDEKYNIQINVVDYNGYSDEIETSTAQSISVIFSFIAGVIQIARENSQPDNGIVVTEPYPLVMDAPLSAFDKTRIKTVGQVLPQVAEQIILFIKDTDGELAEKHMGDKVGKRYNLIKDNEIETHLEKRS